MKVAMLWKKFAMSKMTNATLQMLSFFGWSFTVSADSFGLGKSSA